ncbi:hypothetical protein NIES4074_27950 [Cylindrospermum sp. NIES-4074]|nr:hypothetical protein NIES4074_27950 [Cylindrospermum sp. NIES-4074]
MNYNWIAEKTFGLFASEKLKSICGILNFKEQEINATLNIFNLMAGSWSDLTIGTKPRWFSDITEDSTPFEFSLSLNGEKPVLRFLTDNLSELNTLESSWALGCKLNEELEKRFGASIARFKQIKDIFAPDDPQALFAMWHAVDLEQGRQPKFKLYLNPQCRGIKQAPALVEKALHYLGFTKAWHCISQFALQRGEQDELKYFSLDLSYSKDARFKVYVVHKNATIKNLADVLAGNPYHEHGEVIEFCRATNGQQSSFTNRPVVSSFAFTNDDETHPFSTTLHVPIQFYVSNDEIAIQKSNHILSPQEAAINKQVISCVADRPLAAGTGIQTYLSLKRQQNKKSITSYIAPETYKLISSQT